MVHLLVSERAGLLKQKIKPRMIGMVTVNSHDKHKLFEASLEARFL